MTIDVEKVFDRRADNRWERISVGDLFERMTWSQPDKEALIATPCAARDPEFVRVTYRQADRIVNQIAHALLGMGYARGDRMALFCDNSNEAFLVKIAIAKAGLVVVPINTMMAPDMIVHSLKHTGNRAAIADADLLGKAQDNFATAGVALVAVIPDASGECHGFPSLRDLMQGQPTTEPDVRIHGDDIWEILMTSGTTSMPKAVMISHTYTYMAGLNQALSFSRGLQFESDFRVCTYLPVIFHVSDQIFAAAALLTGGSLMMGRVPSPAAMIRDITTEKPSALFGGSPQFLAELARVAQAADASPDLSSLQVIVYGWGALHPETTERLRQVCKGVNLIGIFGQTECIALHRFPIDRWPEVYHQTAPATNIVGVPSPLLASTVMDSEGNSLHKQPGVPGEAVYRSPIVTAGYFRDEEATREAFQHGWFHSGDVCEFRDDGLRVMVDRYKDVIKSGGENVSSLRIESVVAAFPGVSRVAVVGLPDQKWGEAVTAVVIPQENCTIDEAELISFCRHRLAGYESPKRVVIVDELPVTVGGKVLKYKLRQRLSTEAGSG